jgi:hypothetical protein
VSADQLEGARLGKRIRLSAHSALWCGSWHRSEGDPKDLLAAPHNDHLGIAASEAGVCFEFSNDLEGMLPRRVVIGEVGSVLVIDHSGALGDKKIVTQG